MRRERIPILALTIFVLLVAMWAGLVRMGWRWPAPVSWPGLHGVLMISGFLGALIGLERAVAINELWTYSGPVLSVLSSIWLMLGLPPFVGQLGLWFGSGLILALFVVLLQRQAILPVWIMGAGALMWVVGNGLWLFGYSIPRVILWWIGFLALTIVGERIELARILALRKNILQILYATLLVYAIGTVVALIAYDTGIRIAGLGLVVMALWLLRYDIARRTVKLGGLPTFAAVCLLTGYVWMALAGMMALTWGGVRGGFQYDAWLHSFFIGFVISMIFGHAPIIFPTVLGLPIEYRRGFYGHLILLHLSLAVRIVGDLEANFTWRLWGSLLNAIAILLFIFVTAVTVVQVRQKWQQEQRLQQQVG